MKVFLLPENVRNSILQYLQKKPFEEVAPGIQVLSSLQEASTANCGGAASPVLKQAEGTKEPEKKK